MIQDKNRQTDGQTDLKQKNMTPHSSIIIVKFTHYKTHIMSNDLVATCARICLEDGSSETSVGSQVESP